MDRAEALARLELPALSQPTPDQLKQRWRLAAREFGANTTHDASEALRRLNEAYEFLAKPIEIPKKENPDLLKLRKRLVQLGKDLEWVNESTKLWSKDDNRIPKMRQPIEREIAEIEKALAALV